VSLETPQPTKDALSVQRGRHNLARMTIVAVLIASLALTAFTRQWAVDRRRAAQGVHFISRAASGSSPNRQLSAMPSYATALLLGGLRGPLVMTLWMQIESQKQQNNLQDIDTMIEWTRLLQSEFDTVHLFQIWNKAYNISVKMASLADKYSVIIDAVDYANRVDSERPDDINIFLQTAMVYGEKLGNSQEKVYYRGRVRHESQTLIRVTFPPEREADFRAAAKALGWNEDESPLGHERKSGKTFVRLAKVLTDQLHKTFSGPDVGFAAEVLAPDTGERRIRLAPFLDENGYILPQYLVQRYPGQPYTGADLQPLEPYQPFPYGLSTVALGYNYYKRAQLLQANWGVKSLQTGQMVVDSRPALSLKMWAMEEWERGRRAEMRLLKKTVSGSTEPVELEKPSLELLPSTPTTDQAAFAVADYSYRTAVQLFADAYNEYDRACKANPGNANTWLVHVDDCVSGHEMMQADLAYIRSFHGTNQERLSALRDARQHYLQAILDYQMTILKFYTDDTVADKVFPKDPQTGVQYNRVTIRAISQEYVDGLFRPQTSDADQARFHAVLDIESAILQAYLYKHAIIRALPRGIDGLFWRVVVANEAHFVDPDTGQYSPARDPYHDDRDTYLKYIDHCMGRITSMTATPQPVEAPATQPNVAPAN